MPNRDGGYDNGYRAVSCFWGDQPGSFVRSFIGQDLICAGHRVLDLGCGEGKNAAALADLGCRVDAIDCSAFALRNGRKIFSSPLINWIEGDASNREMNPEYYDLVIAYGLFHCLQSQQEIRTTIERIKLATRKSGHQIICTFNDRSQDSSAHPGFYPTLLPHTWYLDQYEDWTIIEAVDSNIVETHPHNAIQHHHSLTRMIIRKPA